MPDRHCLLSGGDVYIGLEAYSMSTDNVQFAQDHLRILSGLYGVLRPLDLIQPYRLEMGTRLDTEQSKKPVPVLGWPDYQNTEPGVAAIGYQNPD